MFDTFMQFFKVHSSTMPKADHAITQLNIFNISPYFMQNEGVNGYNSTICYASLHLLSQSTQIYILYYHLKPIPSYRPPAPVQL